MPVVNTPTWHHWPVLAHGTQRYGHFVLVRIDPVASVAVLDDAEASRAAALLPRDWFLGIVIKNAGNDIKNAKNVSLLNLGIYLVGLGPPEPPSAAIPIASAPQLSDDHPPIQLSVSELPWPNLYAHSFYSLNAVITRINDGPDHFPASLTAEQVREFVMLTTRDQYDRSHKAYAEQVKNAAATAQQAATSTASSSGSESRTDSAGTDDVMLSEDAQAIDEKYQRYRIYAELWLGPSACPGQPAPPLACRTTVIKLNEIADTWYDRKIEEIKTRRPQLIEEWNQRVREAAGDLVTAPVEGGEQSQTLDDDAILPEDAVDWQADTITGAATNGTLQTRQDLSTAIIPASQPRLPEQAAAREDDALVSTSPAHRPSVQASTTSPSQSSPPTIDGPTAPSSSKSTKKGSIVRGRLASMKHAAVSSFRFVIARVKARTFRDS